jgi:signal transduction histidine kinase
MARGAGMPMEKANILMVDDQRSKLLSYEAILGELGENLIKANSGKEALDHLLRTDIAVVLMDVRMPELDGFEVAEMIRNHPRFQKTAIIFVSAEQLTDEEKLKGYRRGAVDYMSVPVNPEVLRAKVTVFVDLHRQSRQLDQLNRELHNLSSRLMTLQDEERRQVARELHESLGQDLVAAKMMVEQMDLRSHPTETSERTLNGVTNLMDAIIQKMRSLSHHLRPPLLDEVGLCAAVRWYLDELNKRSGIDTSLDVEPPKFPRLRPEVETTIFRIVQEALTNVFRHSGARHASVSLTAGRDQVVVIVRDDGKGIALNLVGAPDENVGAGLGVMKQRAQDLGGELRLQNMSPGTVVKISVPTIEGQAGAAKATELSPTRLAD